MHYLTTTLLAAVAAPVALAETIKITATSDLTFDPEMVTAAEGDILEFYFMPQNHSVAMGEFGSINGACVPANEGGFFSGYMPTESGLAEDVFQVRVNNTDPMVFYCTQGNHCAQGMIGVVNADEDLLNGYKENATSVARAVPPRGVFGGHKTKPGSDASEDGQDDDDDDDDNNQDGDNDDDDSGANVLSACLGVVGVAFGVALML